MTNLKDKFKNTKDKVIGKTMEGAGKTTGNEEMELKGKLEYQKADLMENLDDTKEKIIKKVNDKLDEK